MSDPDEQPQEHPDAESDERTPHEKPEVGLIADEDLPVELRATDDNPLAQSPEEQEDKNAESETPQVEGLPDIGQPG